MKCSGVGGAGLWLLLLLSGGGWVKKKGQEGTSKWWVKARKLVAQPTSNGAR